MSVSLVTNAYLDEASAKTRLKPVPWEVMPLLHCSSCTTQSTLLCFQGYQRAGLVTSDELALIKKVDRQPKAKAESILLSDGPKYAMLYLKLLKKIQRTDTMSCILVLIADALAGEGHKYFFVSVTISKVAY